MTDTFSLTAEELITLCSLTGVTALPGLSTSDVTTLDEEQRVTALATAFRSLAARGLVGDHRDESADRFIEAVRLAAVPAVRALVVREVDNSMSAVHLAAVPGQAVQQCWTADDIHEFSRFPQEDLYLRMLGAAGLLDGERGDPVPGEVKATGEVLARAGELAKSGDVAAAADLLATANPERNAMRRLVAAMAEPKVSVQVAVSYGRADGTVRTSEAAWLDGGPHGIWGRIIEAPDIAVDGPVEKSVEVTLSSLTAESLRDHLLGFLPQ